MQRFWNSIAAFFHQHLGGDRPVEPQPGALEALLDPLEDLRRKALQTRDDADLVRKQALEEERSAIEVQHGLMLGDILQLHSRLDTGLGESELRSLSDELKSHCNEFRSQHPGTLVQWAMAAVAARFHQEALSWGWDEFERRRKQAGIAWPLPGGLAPNADAEEVDSHRRMQHRLNHQQFVEGALSILADLMLGVVPSWRALYPEQGGTVWVGTVFEAVAGALAGLRWRQISRCAASHHADIESVLARALGTELDDIEKRLRQGVSSLAEARELSEQAVGRCRQVAPEVVWQYLQPFLPSNVGA